uniref:Uncharacterized protein n=1 Tax=Oryza brachyantha TaxID=4533 RepID=J3LUM4_ORYBR
MVSDHGPSVSRRTPPASPCSASMTYRFLCPDLPDRNTTHLPSGDGDGNALFSPPTVSFFIAMPPSSSPREIATTSTSVLSLAKSGPMLCISRLSSSSPTTSGRRCRRRSAGVRRSRRSSPRTSPAARRTRSSCRRARRRGTSRRS